MACSCIKGDYNFLLTSLDCETILYQDLSEWMEAEDREVPDTYEVSVDLPGKKSAIVNVAAQGYTKLTPASFNLDTRSLPDGIYCFTTTSCGITYKRWKAITCALECCLTDLIANTPPNGDFSQIFKIENAIKSIHIEAEKQNLSRAQEHLATATLLLKSYNCNCNGM